MIILYLLYYLGCFALGRYIGLCAARKGWSFFVCLALLTVSAFVNSLVFTIFIEFIRTALS